MKKTLLFLALTAGLILAACAPKTTIESSLPTATATAAPTAESTQATITTSQVIPSLCTATSINPTPEPTEAAVLSLFAPVSDSDHILGSATAKVTFMEYSDFQ